MSEPRALVEHFFRHEFGRLGAVLTRSLGMRRLDLVEDVVQAALMQALETWSRRGVLEDPGGWLYRTARNLAIDALRRERTHAQALPRLGEADERKLSPHEAHFDDGIGDEPLRLPFACCHEAVPAESRVALALKTLCGFSTAEIARALLTATMRRSARHMRSGRPGKRVGELPTLPFRESLRKSIRASGIVRSLPPGALSMSTPHSQLVDVSVTPWYHRIFRCVRRAFLCGSGCEQLPLRGVRGQLSVANDR
jgi:RNA polymerase sigma factor (sigma-70 family)